MFQFLLTIGTAIAISGVAAYFSVVGIIAIFASTPVSAGVMASVLEFGKIVTASWLHENWSKPGNRMIKGYLVAATIVLMLITSMGIFGFLSKSFMEHAVVAGPEQDRIALLEQRIASLDSRSNELKKDLTNQDKYVDVYLGAGDLQEARRGVRLANRQAALRDKLNAQIDTIATERQKLSEELINLNANYRKIETEIGPVVYLAEAVYGERSNEVVDKAVRWVIMLIMFSFDPLAILLLIAALITLKQIRGKKEPKVVAEPISDEYNQPKSEPQVDSTPIETLEPEITELVFNHNTNKIEEAPVIQRDEDAAARIARHRGRIQGKQKMR